MKTKKIKIKEVLKKIIFALKKAFNDFLPCCFK